MRTIGTRRPVSSPKGDSEALCGYCGCAYLRSQLRRDASGQWVCPDDDTGRDIVTLGKLIAQDSARPKRVRHVRDGSNWDHTDDPPATGTDDPYTGPAI